MTKDPYKSIEDIKHELQINFSEALSIGSIFSRIGNVHFIWSKRIWQTQCMSPCYKNICLNLK